MNNYILMVDDEPDILEIFGEILKAEGFNVKSVLNGGDAYNLLKSEPFDVVITDIRMPNTDGISLMKHIRQFDNEIELIVLTGYPSLDVAVKSLKDYDVFDFLTKPLQDNTHLVITVKQAIERRQLRQEKKYLLESLKITNRELKQEIEERKKTEDMLLKREKELESKSINLEEVNTALRVLLKKREEDKQNLEEKMLFNVKELVMPYVEKLKNSKLNEQQSSYLEIVESNLNDVVTPFIPGLSPRYLKLTPQEIQVANLVRQGKTTKEIAEFLNLSPRTVEFHRNSIRKKIGLRNEKINLRTYLLSVQ